MPLEPEDFYDPGTPVAEPPADPPASEIDRAPAPTNFGTTTQTFDDGSTIQTFDDGSTLATGTDGKISSSPAPVDSQAVSTQTFDDGSTLTTYADGTTKSTDAPSASSIDKSPGAVDALNYYTNPSLGGTFSSKLFSTNPADAAEAASIAGGLNLARQQTAISAQRGQQQSNDWRVRLQLAQGANYLYKAAQPGILQPLVPTDGIIFPYTPKIDLSYKANYSQTDLTHSNYKGYFYNGSNLGDIGITAHFTAQDTAQANYLLAVIHFFRSATKMFYGQDAQRGSPPPLVFLSGLGQYQFNNHPCLISEFTYNLPDEVDYIRAQTTNQAGLNLTSVNSDKQSVATNAIFASVQRLAAAFTTKGALTTTPFGSKNVPNLAQGSPTYVPTKMDITIRLLPVQTRQQVSKQFSVKGFANGDLIKGGFW